MRLRRPANKKEVVGRERGHRRIERYEYRDDAHVSAVT